MKKEQIEELKKLSGAATPQPWASATPAELEDHGECRPHIRSVPTGLWVASVLDSVCAYPENTELIVAMRNALPTLLREREQLITALKALRAGFERHGSGTVEYVWTKGEPECGPSTGKKLLAMLDAADAAIAAAES